MVDALLGFGVSDAVEVQLLCNFFGAGRFMRRVCFFFPYHAGCFFGFIWMPLSMQVHRVSV